MEPVSAPALDVEAVAAQFPILKREIGSGPLVYLDSGATAQTPEPVLAAMDRIYRHSNANIHRGVYALAQEATDAFEGARRTIAEWLGAAYEETIFTKNVTEAINLVAYSWGRRNVGRGDTVLISPMEHHSNIVPWQLLCQEVGAELRYVEIDDEFRIDLDSLDRELERGPKLVAVTHISNVLGTVNPVEEIVRRSHAAGALVLIDGAQAIPHMRVDVKEVGADFYGFTGHKVYGPTGIGVLYARRDLLEEMPPFLAGGDMISRVDWQESRWNSLPWKFEAGTTPYVEATGLGAAVEWLAGLGIDAVLAHELEVTGYLIERLQEVPGLRILGPLDQPRGTPVSFAMEGIHPHDVAEIVARDGVCIRAGHHCAQPLMRRLGVPATSRASVGVHNSRADVDRLIDGLAEVRRVFA
ncbi:MAG: cysteine desulfurase / selenocysteine lyase [Thermoleophilaceae bacterium]|jgi:cysteine desulfurase/selenocysteine lyase|nr:cysteine desulfurase / selenocysteine lyase [Thermoleophilaceae bacterium]